jgi:hypothetical protein
MIALPLAALLLTHCGKSSDEETAKSSLEGDVKGSIPDVGTIIIDMPSSIAPASGGLKLANDGLQRLFLIPVAFTGVAGQMTTLTKNVVEHIFGKAVCIDDDDSNDAADCAEYRGIISGQISETATVFEIPGEGDEESPSHVKYWANPAGSDYDMGLELYWPAEGGGYVSAMQMQLSKTGEKQGKGEFTFFPNFSGGDGPDVIVTKFQATDAVKTMDVRLYSVSEGDGPTALGLSVTDTDGVITGSGTAIRPEQTADSGGLAPFQTKAEFAYVYTLAADATNNIAVEKLAGVPQSAYADESSYFSAHGVDSSLKNFALELLRNNASPNLNCANSGSYISPELPANICKSNTAVTDEQVLAGLVTFCTNNPNDSGICPIAGQANRWANPIYLDENGYVGNEVYQKPSSAAYLPLVEALSGVTVYTPTAFQSQIKPVLPDAVETVE